MAFSVFGRYGCCSNFPASLFAEIQRIIHSSRYPRWYNKCVLEVSDVSIFSVAVRDKNIAEPEASEGNYLTVHYSVFYGYRGFNF